MGALAVFIGILLGGTVLYLLFRDPTSFLLFGLLIAILLYVLIYFGFISFETRPSELDINYSPTPLAPDSTANGTPPPSVPTPLEEVFYVANNIFTYEKAPTVCKAYGAEVATYSQVEDAYSRGAEWCGYGWTQGGIALFPTQQATWDKLQMEVDPKKRISCGRPGINGGYFEPTTKFGVNCYGIRPTKKPGTGQDVDKEFAQGVDRMKGMLDKISVYPFSSSDWSEYSNISKSIISAEASIKGFGSKIQKDTSGIGSSVSAIGEGVAEGTTATATGIFNLGKSLVTNVVLGIGELGSSIFGGISRGVSAGRSISSEQNPPPNTQ
jgi:hypothetical protein